MLPHPCIAKINSDYKHSRSLPLLAWSLLSDCLRDCGDGPIDKSIDESNSGATKMKRILVFAAACLLLSTSWAQATPKSITAAVAHSMGRLQGHVAANSLRVTRLNPLGKVTQPSPVTAHVAVSNTAAVEAGRALRAHMVSNLPLGATRDVKAARLSGFAQGLSENVVSAPTPSATY
jgi:hypothetical protein